MKQKPSKLYPQSSLIDPATLPAPVQVWGWENGPLCVREKDLLASDVPVTPGRVVVRLASATNVTFDLAWGLPREPGSVRATYSVDVAQTSAQRASDENARLDKGVSQWGEMLRGGCTADKGE